MSCQNIFCDTTDFRFSETVVHFFILETERWLRSGEALGALTPRGLMGRRSIFPVVESYLFAGSDTLFDQINPVPEMYLPNWAVRVVYVRAVFARGLPSITTWY